MWMLLVAVNVGRRTPIPIFANWLMANKTLKQLQQNALLNILFQ